MTLVADSDDLVSILAANDGEPARDVALAAGEPHGVESCAAGEPWISTGRCSGLAPDLMNVAIGARP